MALGVIGGVALAGALMNLGKTAFGAGQLATNKKPVRPEYEIPEEASGIVDMAKRRVSGPMPGIETIEGNIGASTSEAYTEARRQGRFDVGSIFEKNLSAVRDLGVTEANYKIGAEDRLARALELMAGFKDQEFQYNEAGRYSDEQADFFAKRQSGLSNLFGGVQGMLDAGTNLAQFRMTEDIWDAMEPDFMTEAEKAAVRQKERRAKKFAKKGYITEPLNRVTPLSAPMLEPNTPPQFISARTPEQLRSLWKGTYGSLGDFFTGANDRNLLDLYR